MINNVNQKWTQGIILYISTLLLAKVYSKPEKRGDLFVRCWLSNVLTILDHHVIVSCWREPFDLDFPCGCIFTLNFNRFYLNNPFLTKVPPIHAKMDLKDLPFLFNATQRFHVILLARGPVCARFCHFSSIQRFSVKFFARGPAFSDTASPFLS